MRSRTFGGLPEDGWASGKLRVADTMPSKLEAAFTDLFCVLVILFVCVYFLRVLSFMMHVLHDMLSGPEKREIAISLGTLTTKVAGVPHPIARDNGAIIPAVPFTRFPTVK